MLPNRPEARQGGLGTLRYAKSFHPAFTLPCWLVAVLCTVVRTHSRFDEHMLDAIQFGHPGFRRRIAAQLVHNDFAWAVRILGEQATEEAFRRRFVAAPLEQDVEFSAMLVDGTPRYSPLGGQQKRRSAERVLRLGSCPTAWTMLHRFRRAMVRPGRERLKGNVEIDQSYLAIRDRRESPPSAGRKGYTTKTLIVIAVEILEPKGFGRIRLQRIEEETAACVLSFVNEVVEPGSVIRTDRGSIYLSLSED
jgi:hypothetical protein